MSEYILIDFENVQPKNLYLLNGHTFKVIVFIGSNQTKVSFDTADAMQKLGAKAEYVKVAGNGQNALDFHIAFYIGRLSTQDPESSFYIVSKDAGFDPLIKYLNSKNITAQRDQELTSIPVLRIATTTSQEEKIEYIVKNIARRSKARPRKVETLANAIKALFTQQLENHEVEDLIKELENRGCIKVNTNDQRISYMVAKNV